MTKDPSVTETPDIKSWLYADAYLRRPDRRLPVPTAPFWYREPGLYLPLSCAITLIGSGIAAGAASDASITTPDYDTTGANFLGAVGSAYDAATVITDNKSNTWLSRTLYSAAAGGYVQIHYVPNATVGTGHRFTASGGGNRYPALCVAAFSGVDASPYDVENGSAGSGTTTRSTGSVTPSVDGALLIAGLSRYPGVTTSVTLFTHLLNVEQIGGQHVASALAYEIQTTATARNPAWSWTINAASGAAIAVFKVAASAGGRPKTLTMMGAG